MSLIKGAALLRFHRYSGPVLLLLACAAPLPLDSAEPSPHIRLSPWQIDFGESSEPVTGYLTILNIGDDTLNAFVISEDSQVEGPDMAVREVAPGGSAVVVLTWRPEGDAALDGQVRVESDDPDDPVLEVPVTGQGLAGALTSDDVDFGQVALGCEESGAVIVRNTGNAWLALDEPSLSGSDAFSLDGEASELQPDEVAAYTVRFAPSLEGADEAWVEVADLRVKLSGTGYASAEVVDVFEQPDGTQPVDVLFAVRAASSMETVRAELDEHIGVLLEEAGGDTQVGIVLRDDGCFDEAFSTEVEASNQNKIFMLMEGALKTSNLSEGHCNDGFLREGAALHLVGVSDMPEQSVNSSDYYVALFSSLAPATFHGLGGPDGGCETASDFGPMWDAVEDTEGIAASICDADVEDFLRDLGRHASTQPSRTLELTQSPLAETLVVTEDGALRDEWVLDGGSVVVDEAPATGSTVRVTYTVDGCP